MIFPNFKTEISAYADGYDLVAGCDEVGVGPIAGPVVASVCILDKQSVQGRRVKTKWFFRVRDSKTVNEKERAVLLPEILKHCIAFGIGEVPAEEIDRINIHNASMLAMKKAFENLVSKFEAGNKNIFLMIDGRFTIKDLNCGDVLVSQKSIVDADAKILSVAAASIIAKQHRDSILKEMDQKFPGYGFSKHKGYNTKEHRENVRKLGITEIHRRSFLKNLSISENL